MADDLSRYRAPALDKGLDILELLAEAEDGLSQAEIAKRLGRSSSEIYRMIDRLVRRDYLRRTGNDDRLVLGLKLFALSTRHPPMRRLLQAAVEATTDIAAQTLQSCHLALYRDGALFVAAQADSPGRTGLSVRLGATVGLLETGSGLAFLAFQSAPRRQRILAARGTGTIDGDLDATLATVRRTGHLCRPSRQIAGVTDIACPIIGRTGDAVAALTIPFIRPLDPPDAPGLDACTAALARGAAALSAEMPDALSEALETGRTAA
jgi:DNA-binding IclR family transcriptional regulator